MTISEMTLDDIVDKFKKHLTKDFDAWLVGDGPEGYGKSTLLIQTARKVDEDFDIIENVIYRKSERYEKLTARDKCQALIDDEGMRDYYKQFWNTQEQKKANIIYSQSRQTNIFVGICIPRFIDLNTYLRSWRIRNWFHITSRGHFWYSHIDDNPFTKDPWHINDFNRHIEINRITKKGETMTYEDLPKGIKKIYKDEKLKAFKEQIKELKDAQEDRGLTSEQVRILNIDKVGAIDRMLVEIPGMTQKKACFIVGISTKTYQRIKKAASVS